ncbi:MAG: hypothetical protein PVH18_06420 [Chloroflexota bacterium]
MRLANRLNNIIDAYTVFGAFVIVFAISPRLEQLLDSADNGMLGLLLLLGVLYSLYLFLYGLLPGAIMVHEAQTRARPALYLKLMAPVATIFLIYLST